MRCQDIAIAFYGETIPANHSIVLHDRPLGLKLIFLVEKVPLILLPVYVPEHQTSESESVQPPGFSTLSRTNSLCFIVSTSTAVATIIVVSCSKVAAEQ